MKYDARDLRWFSFFVIFFAGIVSFSALADPIDNAGLSLEARPLSPEVAVGEVLVAELHLTNVGKTPIRFLAQSGADPLGIVRDGVTFDLRQSGNEVGAQAPRDTRVTSASGSGGIKQLDPGQSWSLEGCLNWHYSLDKPGKYEARATLILTTVGAGDTPKFEPKLLVLKSQPFEISVKSLDAAKRDARIRHAEELLLRKVTYGRDVAEAIMSLAFCGTKHSTEVFANILMNRPRFVAGDSCAALRVALDRLPADSDSLAIAHSLLFASASVLRREGVRTIYTRGSGDDAPVLVALLNDADYMVRWDACEALEKVAGFRPVEPKSSGGARLADIVDQAHTWWSKRTAEKE